MIQTFCNDRFEKVFTTGILGKQLSKVSVDTHTADGTIVNNYTSNAADIDIVAAKAVNMESVTKEDIKLTDSKVSPKIAGDSIELNPKNIQRIIDHGDGNPSNLQQSTPASPTRSTRSVKSTRSVDSRSIAGSIASISTISKFSASNDSIYNTTAESAAYLIDQQWDMIESSLRNYQT